MTLFSLTDKNNATSSTFNKFIKFDENVVELCDWGFYVETDEKEDTRKKCNIFYNHILMMNKHNTIVEETESDDEMLSDEYINVIVHLKPQYNKGICSALFELFCKRQYNVLPTIVYLLCMFYYISK